MMSKRPFFVLLVQFFCLVALAVCLFGARFWGDDKEKPSPESASKPNAAVVPSRPAPEAIAASRQTALVVASARVAPAVVSVGAESPAYVPYPGLFTDSFFGPPQLFQKIRKKTPFMGSGITLDDQGHIVTNYHVVEGAERLFVTLADGEEYEAKLVDYDEVNDLAFLKVNTKNLHPAVLGDSDKTMLGEWALAIGNPYGNVLEDPTPTITAGVISARNRMFRGTAGNSYRLYENMIQTDAAVNPGNSGGALANAAGEVIGVNTFILSESGGSVGIGFAIPINKVKRMVADIQRYGHIRKPSIDFEPIKITPSIQRQLGLPSDKGLLIYRMETGGLAEASGLQLGDVIMRVNGKDVTNRDDFLSSFYNAPIGSKLTMTVSREGRTFTAEYPVQEQQIQR